MDALPAKPAGVEADEHDQGCRGVGRPTGEGTEPGPPRRDVLDAEGGQHPGRDHRDREADAEADDQREAEAELLELDAQEQDGDGGRARDQAAGQPEQHDLSSRHLTPGEASPDVLRMRPGMGVVLVAQVHVTVVVILLLERDLVGFRTRGPVKAQSRREGVRLGDLLQALQEVAPIGEGERLPPAVRTDRLDGDRTRRGQRTRPGPEAPARRHAVLVHLQRQPAVAGHDVPVLAMVMMVTVVLLAPGPPRHPERDADDEHRRRQLEVRLGRLATPFLAEILSAQRDHPDDRGVRERRRQPEQDRLRDRAPDRDDEGGHHRLRMAGLQAVQGAEQDGARHEQPGMRGPLLQQVGERGHGAALVI